MQPDSTAFHRLNNLTQARTDKKENINCPRFAFLKISKIRFAAHLLVAAFGGWASPTTSKRAAILSMHNSMLSYFIIECLKIFENS